ncbi:MAG: transposase family protein [Candidatus Electrothrix sp. GM3_4]|nr:transposase family protein [Candidatus Electrothrix sp. GM3_4]
MSIKIRNDRHLRSLTGVTQEQFNILLETFTLIFEMLRQRSYQEGLSAGTRRRCPGGGRKGALPFMRNKLLFVLYYFKLYPTFDVLGTQFEMSRSKANENLHGLCPVLYEVLVHLKVMPHREFETPDELMKVLNGIDTILIDVTEKIIAVRKIIPYNVNITAVKKRHTVKNTVMSTLDKTIFFLGGTFSGHTHDYTMLKEEFPPGKAWFKFLQVLADLGY